MLGVYYLYFCCRIINLLNYEVVIVDVSSIFFYHVVNHLKKKRSNIWIK